MISSWDNTTESSLTGKMSFLTEAQKLFFYLGGGEKSLNLCQPAQKLVHQGDV